jgi:hypothetical protein
MSEINAKPNENAKPAPKEQSQMAEQGLLHPILLSDESIKSSDEKEKPAPEGEQKLREILRSINDETLQLGDFLSRENMLVNELCMSLTEVLKKLDVSFNIPQQDIPLGKKVKKVILSEQGHLSVTGEEGEVKSAFLAEYSPEIVMAVLWVVIPELAKIISLYRKRLSARVGFFEGIKKELKSVAKAIVGNRDENLPADKEQTRNAAKKVPMTEVKS